MLDVMRSNAKSSLIVLVFGVLIFVFIFSFGRGSSGFKAVGSESWAARVNGDLVTASDFQIRDATELLAGGEFNIGNTKSPFVLRGGVFTNHDHSLRYVGNVQPHSTVTADQAARINAYERSVFNEGTHDTRVTGTLGTGVAIGPHLTVDAGYAWKERFVVSTGARF